jgi:hypothetical protein
LTISAESDTACDQNTSKQSFIESMSNAVISLLRGQQPVSGN